MKYGMVVRGLFAGISLFVIGGVAVQSNSKSVLRPPAQEGSPATRKLFACFESWPESKQKNRIAVLHGPDWVLQSSIKPPCFPDREEVFSVEIGKHFLSLSIAASTRLWVTKVHDVTHVRIVESSGIEKQDMIAVSIVSNRRCINKNSNHCSVKGGAAPVRID
jgi:hypothetical protein